MQRRASKNVEVTELQVVANGLRDLLGLPPLYVFSSDGRVRDWRLGMPYGLYPKFDEGDRA
jgi:hypothetical protein